MLIDADELVHPTTVASELHVRPQTLVSWRSLGRGPAFVKVGRAVFYRRRDVAEWLGTRHRQPQRAGTAA
jgi:hypothetical protein